MPNAPGLVEVDNTRLEEVLLRVEQSLDEKDSALVRAVFESYAYVADLVEDKNTSIRRLRQLFFVSFRQTCKKRSVRCRAGTSDSGPCRILAGDR
jgi:transposase